MIIDCYVLGTLTWYDHKLKKWEEENLCKQNEPSLMFFFLLQVWWKLEPLAICLPGPINGLWEAWLRRNWTEQSVAHNGIPGILMSAFLISLSLIQTIHLSSLIFPRTQVIWNVRLDSMRHGSAILLVVKLLRVLEILDGRGFKASASWKKSLILAVLCFIGSVLNLALVNHV